MAEAGFEDLSIFNKFTDLAKALLIAKRNILMVSASFYDPLGFISPVLLGLSVFSKYYVKKVMSGIKK